MPRFVPATVSELQRIGLFGALSGAELTRLADGSERVELPSGATFGIGGGTVDVLLSGLARGAEGLMRPGSLVDQPATAVTPCVAVRCDRDTLAALFDD